MIQLKKRFARRSVMPGMLLGLLAISAAVDPAPVAAQEPTKPVAKAQELQKERLATMREMLAMISLRFKNNEGTFEELRDANRMVLEAELALCESSKDRVAVLEKFLVEAKNLEKLTERAAKIGQGRASTSLLAKADRLQAEIALELGKTKATNATSVELQHQLELAENQVAIKKAAVRVAQAQKAKAVANVASMKLQLAEAKAAESLAEKQLNRYIELSRAKAIDDTIVDEGRSKLNAAKARRETVEGNISECETQVVLDQARLEVAQLEAEESLLRLKHLKSSTISP